MTQDNLYHGVGTIPAAELYGACAECGKPGTLRFQGGKGRIHLNKILCDSDYAKYAPKKPAN